MDRGLKREGFAVIAVLLLAATTMQAHAATITVTNTNDSGPGSLRQALANANNGDRINFAVTGTITLTSGGLVVTKNVTISGPGANQLSIDGNQATLVFGVFPQRTVSISGLSITNGQYGIWNEQGTLTVSNCVSSGNSFTGLYNHGGYDVGASVTIANSVISNNSGTGAINEVPPTCCFSTSTQPPIATPAPFQMSDSNTLARNSADQLSDPDHCACMTITDSVVSNNAENGITNSGVFGFSTGPATLTVVNSNVSDNDGTGISNDGTEGVATVTIAGTTASGNSAGGVFTQEASGNFFGFAQVTITNSTISGNSANGGIRSQLSFLTVANSTISGNSSGDIGGGIYASRFPANNPSASIVNSTISGNSAGTSGGGIYAMDFTVNNSPSISIVNSTISGNSAGTSGGGIYNSPGTVEIANCTVSGNSAGSGGGIYNQPTQTRLSVVEISNTILNAGALGANIFNSGTVTSHGYNLSSDDGGGYLNGPGDQIDTDPLLGPLQDNGGPTFTHALSPRSPAINAGDPSFTPPPLYDQRGSPFVRVFNGRIDIGSFEAEPRHPRRHPTPHPRPTPP